MLFCISKTQTLNLKSGCVHMAEYGCGSYAEAVVSAGMLFAVYRMQNWPRNSMLL